jgi:hypothetical protein
MILEEFCKVCGYNRKYAIWLLNRPLPKAAIPKRTISRSPTYSEVMVGILAKVWEASGYLCSQRLKAALVHWLPWIRQRFELTQPLEDQLLERLYKLASRADRAPREIPPLKQTRQRPEPLPHINPSPWRNWTFSKKLQRQQQNIKRKMKQQLG